MTKQKQNIQQQYKKKNSNQKRKEKKTCIKTKIITAKARIKNDNKNTGIQGKRNKV